MPRGRIGQTAGEAKEETFLRLMGALTEAHPDGLKFTDWMKASGVHRDTVSRWIPKLVRDDYVVKIGHTYRLTKDVGVRELRRSLLLSKIKESGSYCITGGKESESLDPAQDVRLRSTIAYAFPSTWLGFLDIKELVHKSYIAFWLYMQAYHHMIDSRYLTGELPKDQLLNILREKLPRGTQVFAFSIDFDKIRELINEDYLSDILSLLGESEDMAKIGKLALEAKALDLLKTKKFGVELSEISVHLGIDPKEAEHLLDNLVVNHAGPMEKRIKTKEGEVRLKIAKAKRFLKKNQVGKSIYYRFVAGEA